MNQSNSKTQKTSKQKKPKKLKAKKEKDQEKSATFNIKQNIIVFLELNCIKKRKENVVYVNGGCVIAVMNIQKLNLTMEEILLDKFFLEKLIREGKSLAFYAIINKVETLNMP